ncbi:MAG: DUF4403 family protein [Gemmatimonadaceae bacterium]|nr:DUF4403 family protein [Gemmatimonadaceae bacterium]
MIRPTVSAVMAGRQYQAAGRVVITTDLEVNADWQIRARSRVRSVRPVTETDRDACRVTMFHIDVTDRVVAALRPQLQSRLPAVDRKIPRSICERASSGGTISSTRAFASRTVSGWSGTGFRFDWADCGRDTALIADVRLFARPLLVYGPQPARITTTLPPLVPANRVVGDSAHLLLEGLLGYDAASTLLAKQLVGRHFSRFGRRVAVKQARLYPLGDGRVVLALGMDGAIGGDACFMGTPKWIRWPACSPCLTSDFDVATANALVLGLAWLKKRIW